MLVPLVQRDDGLHVLLTRRTDHLHDHAGQISFPGGRQEPEDQDETATALRETLEEIGLGSGHVEVLGRLPVYTTVTRVVVTPVVALVRPPFELRLDAFEVAEAITARDVELAIRQSADERLVAVEIFDIYRGEPIPVGYKSMAYRLTYQSQQRGLNEKEVTQLRGRIIKTVETVTGGKLRG